MVNRMISVVVPTYNERENVRPLFERLVSSLSCEDFEVLLVDDDSPDGTADAARVAGKELDLDIQVIVRISDPDLSQSVVRGVREARGDVVVMDADLQHPPELIPDLVSAITPEIPFAIGSQYTSGGRNEMRFGTRLLIGLFGHSDLVRLGRFVIVGAVGAVVNLSILYALTSGGLHYLISGAIAIEAAVLFNFFLNKVWTFSDVEFDSVTGVIGALFRDHGVRSFGMGVNLLFLWVLTDIFGIYYIVSQVIGAGVAALWNFIGNLLWTWDL